MDRMIGAFGEAPGELLVVFVGEGRIVASTEVTL